MRKIFIAVSLISGILTIHHKPFALALAGEATNFRAT